MLFEKTEDFEIYSCEIVLNELTSLGTLEKAILAFISKTDEKPDISFEYLGTLEYEGQSIDDLLSCIKANATYSSEDEALVKIIVHKPKGTISIYNQQLIFEWIDKFTFSEKLEIITRYFFDQSIISSIHKDYTTYSSFFNNLQYPIVSFEQKLLASTVNSDVSPTYLTYLEESFVEWPKISKFFRKVRDLVCTAMLSNSFDLAKTEFQLSNEVSISSSDIKKLNDNQSSELYNVYLWAYRDDSFSIKCSVFSNIVSMQSNFSSSLNDRFIPLLKSNLNILLKENFTQYVEAKSSVLDYLFDISTKIKEQLSSQKSAFNNSLFAICGFFFTSIVFTAIDKGKFQNIFTYEVTIISTVFVICSMIYMGFVQRDIENSISQLLMQKDEYKQRFNDVFSSDELDTLFSPRSLSLLIDDARNRDMFFTYQAIMMSIVIVSWSLHGISG